MVANGASPTKRAKRRTQAEIRVIRDAIVDVVERLRPVTVRQTFYQLVSRGVIAKTEAEYKGTVCRLLAEMRRDGTLPYDSVADNTRWMRKPRSYGSLYDFLERSQRLYRRNLWDYQEAYCECWLEKEALAGVLYDVTEQWDVPLMVTRGYPSISFIHSAAETIRSVGKPVYLSYFGDHDPSGVDIPRFVEESMRELAPDADITFERIAVTPEQISEYRLATRPTKRSDSRAKNFEGQSVEVDAIDPDELRRLCEQCIMRHIDAEQLEASRRIESMERETIQGIALDYRD